MLAHTAAFLTYRDLSQSHLNFVVLVCYAVPALRAADISLSTAALSNPPDHFKSARNPKSEVAGYVSGYQEELARSALITIFSYFEDYVKEVLIEIVEYHGGEERLRKIARKQIGKSIHREDRIVQVNKRKLQDNFNKAKVAKYQKYIGILDKKSYKFPSDLFAYFGLVQLLPKLWIRREV